MALEATHLRFALELQSAYNVKNIGDYILGTSYPDSRCITGISRDLTHGDFVLKNDFSDRSDFNKGWQVHQICDLIQHKSFKNKISLLKESGEGWPEDKWVHFTAAKIIQDMIDRQSFKIIDCLPYLRNAKNPNGEDINQVIKYNTILIEQYNKREISSAVYCRTLVACGVDEESAMKTLKKIDEFWKNLEFIEQINTVFSDMVNSYRQITIF